MFSVFLILSSAMISESLFEMEYTFYHITGYKKNVGFIVSSHRPPTINQVVSKLEFME